MTTIIPTPAPVPDPLSSDFGTKAYDFTVWMAAAAPAMTAVAQETNDALNQSLLSVVSTSTSSITIASSGTINITVEANKGYAIGMTVKIASTANPANYVKGTITAYNKTTGATSVALFNKGGSGTFSSWSVFFDVPDPSVLSVPTGEAVAAGNLLAIDDAGNSMSVESITTAVLQAVTATSFYAFPLVNGNTCILWTAGSTDVRMMIINKSGGTVLASTSVATGGANTHVWGCELTNGNLALVYTSNSVLYPVFKIVNTSGAQVVAETVIESAQAQVPPKCCALTGGGFAVTYCGASAYHNYAVYTNAGGVTKAWTTAYAVAQTKVATCSLASGGFASFSGMSGRLCTMNAAGTIIDQPTGGFASSGVINIASKTGSINVTGLLGIQQYSDVGVAPLNTISTLQLLIPFYDISGPTGASSVLGSGHTAVLGDGNYITTFAPYVTTKEFPKYAIHNEYGQMIRTGILFTETTYDSSSPVYVIPKDTNGFSLIWLAANRNIKFAQVKSGNIVGISSGAVGSTHQYLANGSANVASGNMLNVGGSKINYTRQGAKVVI